MYNIRNNKHPLSKKVAQLLSISHEFVYLRYKNNIFQNSINYLKNTVLKLLRTKIHNNIGRKMFL